MGLDLNVHHSTVSKHLKNMGMSLRLDKWVPHQLNEKQKMKRLTICSSLKVRLEKENFLKDIITCDEKWIAYSNPHRGKHWIHAGSPPLKIAKSDLHPRKVLLCLWWSIKGIIHHEFLKSGQTVNSDIYCSQIEEVHKKLKDIDPAMINRRRVIILQDNAKPHTSKKTIQKFSDIGYEILSHPPYSPDISPTDYHVFLSMSNFLRGKNFDTLEDLQNCIVDFLSRSQSIFSNPAF